MGYLLVLSTDPFSLVAILAAAASNGQDHVLRGICVVVKVGWVN